MCSVQCAAVLSSHYVVCFMQCVVCSVHGSIVVGSVVLGPPREEGV